MLFCSLYEPLLSSSYELSAGQGGMSLVLAASVALTAPTAYAAPFETGTGLAPLGKCLISECSILLLIPLPFPFLSKIYVAHA